MYVLLGFKPCKTWCEFFLFLRHPYSNHLFRIVFFPEVNQQELYFSMGGFFTCLLRCQLKMSHNSQTRQIKNGPCTDAIGSRHFSHNLEDVKPEIKIFFPYPLFFSFTSSGNLWILNLERHRMQELCELLSKFSEVWS